VQNRTLTSLDLRGNALHDEGLNLVATALRENRTLLSLDISHNGLLAQYSAEAGTLPRGWRNLCEVLCEEDCPLISLALGGQHIPHSAVAALVETLDANSRLQQLDLKAAELSAHSVARLCVAALDHPSLLLIDLRVNSVTANTRDLIQDRLAQATMAHGGEQESIQALPSQKRVLTGSAEAETEEGVAGGLPVVAKWKIREQRPWEALYSSMY